MNGRKRTESRRLEHTTLVQLARGSELVLADAETTVLVVRGACHVRRENGALERVQAGSVLVGQSDRKKRDRLVARALELLQSAPEKRWTVERLARAVGLSRAAFARRFAQVTGTTPLRQLTELRLALAASLLTHEEDIALAELAARVGYASEFALSRAFKRRYGVAPGVFRRSVSLPATHSRTLALAA